jgi:hypothetical protein
LIDVFLSKNDNSGRKTQQASEWVEYDFYFTEYDFCPVWSRVLIFTHCKNIYKCKCNMFEHSYHLEISIIKYFFLKHQSFWFYNKVYKCIFTIIQHKCHYYNISCSLLTSLRYFRQSYLLNLISCFTNMYWQISEKRAEIVLPLPKTNLVTKWLTVSRGSWCRDTDTYML